MSFDDQEYTRTASEQKSRTDCTVLKKGKGLEGEAMSAVLVIGGDRLGNITDVLHGRGYRQIYHVTGRKHSQYKVNIPADTKMIVVFTDFVNHNLSCHVKSQAKAKKLPIVFCRRSCTMMEKVL
ncbi:DUF2325 domain-containing protein [Brevibacillus borstelensis]|uniref:DUF2325 domain-containing protein n=1 Tax=Brevibacillus TaxID=55080 RepID=UPI0030F83846